MWGTSEPAEGRGLREPLRKSPVPRCPRLPRSASIRLEQQPLLTLCLFSFLTRCDHLGLEWPWVMARVVQNGQSPERDRCLTWCTGQANVTTGVSTGTWDHAC